MTTKSRSAIDTHPEFPMPASSIQPNHSRKGSPAQPWPFVPFSFILTTTLSDTKLKERKCFVKPLLLYLLPPPLLHARGTYSSPAPSNTIHLPLPPAPQIHNSSIPPFIPALRPLSSSTFLVIYLSKATNRHSSTRPRGCRFAF